MMTIILSFLLTPCNTIDLLARWFGEAKFKKQKMKKPLNFCVN